MFSNLLTTFWLKPQIVNQREMEEEQSGQIIHKEDNKIMKEGWDQYGRVGRT